MIVAQYFYGASGERIGKEDYDASGNAKSYTQYQRDGSTVIMEETWRTSDMKETAQKTYVYAGGRMAVTQGKNWTYPAPGSDMTPVITTSFTYYATDHLGTVRFVYTMDTFGNLVSSSTHDYSPFGVEIGPVETSDNTHKYTGQERDPETGNDYMHYRFYGDSIGRFMKPDNVSGTMENPQDWNLYSYTHGNPVTFDDPTGHGGQKRTREAGGCSDTQDTPKKKARQQKALTAKSSPKANANQQAQHEADQQTKTNDQQSKKPKAVSIEGGRKGGRRGKGQRGKTRKPDGTNNPGKHVKEDPENPGQYLVWDKHQGRWKRKPKGWKPGNDSHFKMPPQPSVLPGVRKFAQDHPVEFGIIVGVGVPAAILTAEGVGVLVLAF